MKTFHASFAVLLFALLLPAGASAQGYPQRIIEEIQFVLDPGTDDQSFLLGDTVAVRGLVVSDVRSLALDGGWGCFIVDPDLPTDPWQGLLVVQSDTSAGSTGFGTLQPGMICRFTGVIQEVNTETRLALLTDPAVPVVIESVGGLLPQPIPLGTADVTDRASGEQWEGQLVRIDDALLTDDAYPSNRAIIEDGSGLPAFLDDGFAVFRDGFDNGTFAWPATGSILSATGFVAGIDDGLSVNPRDFADLIVRSSAPEISEIFRDPIVPTDRDSVVVSATVTDDDGVAGSRLHYSVDFGPWATVDMTASGNEWSATIPAQADGSFLRYFLSAMDSIGNAGQMPADTSLATGTVYRCVVRNTGLRIADVQNPFGYGNGASPYEGLTVTVEGVVMSSPDHFAGYYIQDAGEAWSGIFVRNIARPFAIGDLIRVRGRVEEDFGLTKISAAFVDTLLSGVGPFDPVPLRTGDLATGGALAEAFESVLVSFANVTVTDAFPDHPNNFGEFIIDDGSGGLRVDDESERYDGNLTEQIENGASGSIRGIHFYSFGDFKLAPRDSHDVDLLVGIGESESRGIGEPVTFALAQNYPNPFNPETRVEFAIAHAEWTTLVVYDVLGRKVRTLVNERMSAGRHVVRWDGRDDSGRPVAGGTYLYRLMSGAHVVTRKMVFMK